MTVIITGKSNTDVLVKAIDALDAVGRTQQSKISANPSQVVSVGHAVVTLTNPLQRWMAHPARRDNILGVMGEALWVLSAGSLIDGWMSVMVPRAKQFSDDLSTWRGAYGERLYTSNQLQSVTDRLRADIGSRKGVVSIHDPMRDSDSGIMNEIGSVNTADMICNIALSFKCPDKRLNLTVFNRSNDLVWGLTNVNIVEFSLIQEIMAVMLKVELGNYTVMTDDLHWYPGVSSIKKQVDGVRDNPDVYVEPPLTVIDLGGLNTWYKLQQYFSNIIMIAETRTKYGATGDDLFFDVMEEVGHEFQPGSTLDLMIQLSVGHFLHKVTGNKQKLGCEHVINSPFAAWVRRRVGEDKWPFITE